MLSLLLIEEFLGELDEPVGVGQNFAKGTFKWEAAGSALFGGDELESDQHEALQFQSFIEKMTHSASSAICWRRSAMAEACVGPLPIGEPGPS